MASPVPIILIDGGLGTTLETEHNIIFSEATPLWSSHLLLSPQGRRTLLKCQAAFVRAGAQVLLTPTYQASEAGFRDSRTDEFPGGVAGAALTALAGVAVDLSRQAAVRGNDGGGSDSAVWPQPNPRVRLALSLGPYGACMAPSQEYTGQYDAPHDSIVGLTTWHLSRLGLFLPSIATEAGSVDTIAYETVPRVDEVLAVRQCLSQLTELDHVPFWISCVFPEATRNRSGGGHTGLTLPDGTPPRKAVEAMLDPSLARRRPFAIGVNCVRVQSLSALLVEYEAAVRALLHDGRIEEWPALVVYPDGTDGEVYDPTTKTWVRPGPDVSGGDGARNSWETVLSKAIFDSISRGASWSRVLAGGCCRTAPRHIRELGQALQAGGHKARLMDTDTFPI